MKKKLSLMLAVLLVFTSVVYVGNYQADMYYSYVSVYFNGREIYAVGPYIEYGRTIVSLRRMVEGIGGEVKYNEEDSSIEITYRDRKAVLQEYSDTMQITRNGKTWTDSGDYMPFYNDYGNLMIPVRAIADAFNLNIEWNPRYNSVVLLDVESAWEKISNEAPIFYDMLTQENDLLSVSGNIESSMLFSIAVTDQARIAYSTETKGRIKNGDAYLREDLIISVESDGEKESGGYTTETILKDDYIYTKAMGENPLVNGPENYWYRSEKDEELLVDESVSAKELIEEMLSDESSYSLPEQSYHSLDTITKLLIMLEKDYITQTERDGMVTTELILNDDNIEMFLKEFGRIYGYREMTLEEYDEYCRSVDEMLESSNLNAQIKITTGADGRDESLLKFEMIIREDEEELKINVDLKSKFIPSENVEDIQAPPADEIVSDENYDQYESYPLENILPSLEQKVLLESFVPFCSDFTVALIQ